tara:strand:- start:36 stop:857 length:822 start_codon:yes stop_codon:yes gene_type:complete
MKICIAGKNEIAINSVKYLYQKVGVDKKNILVCTNKNDTGKDTWQPSLLKFSKQNKIEVVSLSDLYPYEDIFFISLEFDKILNPSLFKTTNLFNIHFSLLPRYKGMYTSIFPILNGDKISGVTLHKIDEGIDTGNIIDYCSLQIDITDTSRDLYFKCMKSGFKIFKDNIEKILNLKFSTEPQGFLESTYNSKNTINFNKIEIDLNKTSIEIHNQIRAFIFIEYQLPSVKNNKIISSQITKDKIEVNFFKKSGSVIELSGIDGFKVVLKTLEND